MITFFRDLNKRHKFIRRSRAIGTTTGQRVYSFVFGCIPLVVKFDSSQKFELVNLWL